MSKTTNKFSPEVRERAVRLVFDNVGQHGSRWQVIMSIAAKIGCAPQTLSVRARRDEAQKSFTGADRGGAPKPSNMSRWNGSTGSTTAACSSQSGTSRQPRQRKTSMQLWKLQP